MTGGRKIARLRLGLLIPIDIAQLQLPRPLPASSRASLLARSRGRMVRRRLVQRCIVLVMRSTVLLATAKTFSKIVSV